MKTYEALFIFSSTLKDEDLQKVLEQIRGEIKKLGGSVQNTQGIGKRTFAKLLKKRESGQYVKINFNMGPENIAPFEARLKLNEDVFRSQIIKESSK